MENEMVVIEEGKELQFFTEGGLEPFLAAIKEKVDIFEHDMTTAKGRDITRSFAHNIGSFKQRVEEKGVELVGPLKKRTKKIDEGRKHSRDTLDALKARARKPLTDWEDAEKARVAKHQESLELLRSLMDHEDPTAAECKYNLDTAKAVPMGDCWQEFASEAATEKDKVVSYLEGALAKALKAEAEAAELEHLRVEQEAREQKEREDAIRAEEAERVRKEEEEKAAKIAAKVEADRLEALQREADAKARAETEKRERIASEERAKIEKEEAVIRAKTEERVRAEAAETERKHKEAAEAQALEDARLEEEAKADKKKAAKAHIGKIQKQTLDSLIALGVEEKKALWIIGKIDAGEVANVSLNY